MRLVVVYALLCLAGCGRSTPVGEYGAYRPPFKHLVLPDGQKLVVYRVTSWEFSNGQPPGLQIEYEAPFSVSDVERLRQLAYRIWPLFAPYVEGMHLRVGFLTATNLEQHQHWFLTSSKTRHFGLIALRDSTGTWRFQGDTTALPSPDPRQTPAIIDVDGNPMTIPSALPSARQSAAH